MEKVKHIQKNYIAGIINGLFFNLAFAITGSKTILPLFVSTLTSSGFIIGLAGSMEDALWPLPQLFMANYLEGKKYTKFIYIYTAYVRVFAMFAMGFLVLWSPGFILPAFLAVFACYLIAGGMSGISFMEIVGKTISREKITSFWSIRQAGGGLLSILGGIYVRYSLETFGYPFNYAVLFLTAGIFVTIALISFIMTEEPPSRGQQHSGGFANFIRQGIEVLGRDINFKRLFAYRILIGIGMGMVPFYAVFAVRKLAVDPAQIGFFISVQMAGLVLSNIIWDRLSKRYGIKSVMILTAVAVILQPPLSYTATLHINALYPLFFLIGFSIAGLRVGHSSYLLVIAPESKRPTYMGFMNTLTAPVLFYPMLNGFLIDRFSYTPVLIIAVAGALAALITIIPGE